MKGVGKFCVFNGKLAISRKRREIRPRLLLITNRKLRLVKLDGNHRPWMTLKVTDSQYSRLS